MRIDRKQMDQFNGRENVGSSKQTFGNELWIEVIPVFTRYVRCARITCNFRILLNVCDSPVLQLEHNFDMFIGKVCVRRNTRARTHTQQMVNDTIQN